MWPTLSKIASWWCEMPTSSVAVERMFRVLCGFARPNRANMSEATFEAEWLFRMNRRLIDRRLAGCDGCRGDQHMMGGPRKGGMGGSNQSNNLWPNPIEYLMLFDSYSNAKVPRSKSYYSNEICYSMETPRLNFKFAILHHWHASKLHGCWASKPIHESKIQLEPPNPPSTHPGK